MSGDPSSFGKSGMWKRPASLALSIAFIGPVEAAQAQAIQSWVSGTGTGTSCTRTAPCGSLAEALATTAPGGVISILDGYLNQERPLITKAMTIRAEGVDGGISFGGFTGGAGIVIRAGAADVVTLVGLQMNGGGIDFNSGGHLHVVDCRINNATLDGTVGIRFAPDAASKLSVTDTVISNIGASTGGGIVVKPQGAGSARVNLERVTINGNATGIAVDGSTSSAGINMTIRDSMIGGNQQDGLIATTSKDGAPIDVALSNSATVNNGTGIHAIGPKTTVRVRNSEIIGNSLGLSSDDAGSLLTGRGNTVEANVANGNFTDAYPQQ